MKAETKAKPPIPKKKPETDEEHVEELLTIACSIDREADAEEQRLAKQFSLVSATSAKTAEWRRRSTRIMAAALLLAERCGIGDSKLKEMKQPDPEK